MIEYGTKIICSTIELSAGIMLALSLFRIPFRYHMNKIVFIAFILSSISYYLRDAANMADYAVLTVRVCEVILIMIAFSLPFFYALLISIIGFIAGGMIEYAMLLLGTSLHVTNMELIESNILHFNAHHLITAVVILFIVYLLQKKKIGFMFTSNRFTMKQTMKGYNFLLSAISLIGIILIQLVSLSFNTLRIHTFILIILAFIFLICIAVSYRHNKKILKEKYERLYKT